MQILTKRLSVVSQCAPLYPMAVLQASQSILEKWEQTQGQTQVLISQPAASVAAATQATQTTGISIVSTQAGVRIFFTFC